MFSQSAAYYDAIYHWKNYEREAEAIRGLIGKHARRPACTLLDVACGTGQHMAFLREHFTVQGLDLDPGLLEVARARCPGGEFVEADMVDFDLGQQFDAVICLFSAIGYVKTVPRLQQAVASMTRHLQPGGVLIVEPWFTPDAWNEGTVHAVFVDQPGLKIARISVSEREDRLSRNDFHYLVATAEGVRHFTERHELGLFTQEDYTQAFRVSGLDVMFDLDGLTGRGLYIGSRPL
jgi:ubiquinone/menaquinone biosynthesis C-methylase UbiE